MKLAIHLNYSGSKLSLDVDRVLEAERLGYDSIWTAEAYGSDAVVPAASYAGPDATGLGKPLKSILHGRADMPIYIAAIGPKNVALTAEIADGWIPIFFSPKRMPMFRAWLDEGFRRAGKAPANFDIMPGVTVVLGDDVDACRASVKSRLAL